MKNLKKLHEASIRSHLVFRSQFIQKIRQFFADRDVLEVETPLLYHTSATDPHLQSFVVDAPCDLPTQYLLTSPEFPMKRLLAAGSGCIYQISKAFRAEPESRLHNPEFTILEWYRVGFDLGQLMEETDELLQSILLTPKADRMSYQQAFERYLNVDPHQASCETLANCAYQRGWHIEVNADHTNRDFWLYLLLSHGIEPHLGQQKPLFLYDFPASQAALAKIKPGNPPVAARFEVYYRGIELANGYHELTDPLEQKRRFDLDNLERQRQGLTVMPDDTLLIAALEQGLPECSGIALGIDRLLMLAAGATSIHEIMSLVGE